MAGRFSVEAVFRAIDRVTAPVSRMQNRVGKFTRSMQRGFKRLDRTLGKLRRGIKTVGLAVVASAAIMVTALAGPLKVGAEFEQAIVDVGAVALQTRDQIRPLEDLALSLGRSTKFTATQAANAMEVMARAGFDANAILKAVPAVLDAAAASGLEIADVADVVSNALKGMGLEASEAARVADVLALASARTNSSMGSLGESIKNVASTARQLGVPFEEVAAAVALLQDVGLDASVAGTAFNTMLTKMAAPTVGMQKKMRRLGISFKDTEGNMLPFQDVLQQLSKASKRVGGNFDQVAFLAELVGLRGAKAASNLATLFETGKLEKLVKELDNAAGSAKKMAAIKMNTVIGSLTLLSSAVDAVKVKMFGLSSGPLKNVIDQFTAWVGVNEAVIATGVAEFITGLITNLPILADALIKIGTGVGAILALSVALKAVSVVLGVINLLMAANPIVLGILAAVAAVALLSGALDPVLDLIKSIGSGIAGLISGVKSIGGVIGFGDSVPVPTPLNTDIVKFSDDSDVPGVSRPQVVSPQDRIARSIEEQRTTSTAEVTIRDETGRAEVTGGRLGTGLQLQTTGDF